MSKLKRPNGSTGHGTGALQEASLRTRLERDRYRTLAKQMRRRAKQARGIVRSDVMTDLATLVKQ